MALARRHFFMPGKHQVVYEFGYFCLAAIPNIMGTLIEILAHPSQCTGYTGIF